ncbi:Mitochondrial import inner membrane translocase subunit tim22 [Sporothrix epigloea]|uniref:Mitochondrial import inner membrane translocase subunit TIM22 n=1 Tax=Sporothrix epigloea TaxID=1892477 RepID=A0ABP0DVF0_9PEZI
MNFPGSGGLAGAGGGRPGIDPNDPNMKRMQAVMDSCFAKAAMSGVAGFGLGGVFGLFMASMAYDTPYHTAVPTQAPPGATGAAATATAPATAVSAAGKSAIGAGAAAPTTITAAATNAATASTVASTTAAPSSTTATANLLKPTSLLSTPAPKPVLASISGGAGAASAYVAPPSIPLRQQLAIGFRDMGSRSWSTAKNFGTVGMLFAGIECGIEGLRAKNDITNGVAAGCLTGAILARNGGPQAAAIGCAGFAAFSAAIDAYMRMPPSDD